jgi:thiamine-monophosphate kinase
MNELEILKRIAARAPRAGRGLVLGIGDDCAIYRSPSADLLLTTDMMIEDVHFRRATHPADAVGWKTLARGLSDIAAMGGTPRLCLVSLAVASWADQRWIDAFYGGLLRLARRTGVSLAGGDLGHAERVMCDIVVCGDVPRGRALRRDGARPGDAVYVSGRLGGSALGLETECGTAWKRHLRPEPRLELGLVLRRLRATACIDLSDGLSLDLHRLCLASKVTAELDGPIPLFRGASIDQALNGGEDYELLFTLRPGAKAPPSTTRIGTIRKGKPGGPLPPRGYDHFRSETRSA